MKKHISLFITHGYETIINHLAAMNDKKDYKRNLHYDAPYFIHRNAHKLRRKQTEAEEKLWQALRNRQLFGKKFRRQHPVDNYILDFYCHECSLAIEVDGAVHDNKMSKEYDQVRTASLNKLGIRVIRFRNNEVMDGLASVLDKIKNHL